MPYLGNIPAVNFSAASYQDLTGGTGTTFTLDYAAGSAQDIEVFVNNVRQEPGVAYTVAGTALTMTGSIVATDDFYVVFQGKAQQTVTPANNSITATMLQSGAVTDAKIDTMAASKLTGALPAIDGSALTGISSGVSQVVSHVTDATTYFERNTTANAYQLLNTTNANDGTSHMSVSITPSSTSSKIMIMMNLNWSLDGADVYNTVFALDRSGTLLLPTAAGSRRLAIAAASPISGTSSPATGMHTQHMLYVDEPNTTSARTYTVAYSNPNSGSTARLWFNRTDTDTDTAVYERGISTLVAQEI